MKTKELYEQYINSIQSKNNDLAKLEQEQNEINNQLVELDAAYKDALKHNDEKKAEKVFNERIEKEDALKKLKNKLTIKRDLNAASSKEEKMKLLAEVGQLSRLYDKDKEELNQQIVEKMQELNNLIKRTNELNDEYSKEQFRYVPLFESLDKDQKKELYNQHRITRSTFEQRKIFKGKPQVENDNTVNWEDN